MQVTLSNSSVPVVVFEPESRKSRYPAGRSLRRSSSTAAHGHKKKVRIKFERHKNIMVFVLVQTRRLSSRNTFVLAIAWLPAKQSFVIGVQK